MCAFMPFACAKNSAVFEPSSSNSSTGTPMDLSKIPAGRKPPDDINALIEIPVGGVPVKYEIDKASGTLFVDRFLHTAMFYPGNYPTFRTFSMRNYVV